nr:hypothetical protein [Tanacetum cinerariifolium]
YGKRAIGTKWVYRNKKDERGIVIRNKARLVAQGHTQEEGIDYEEKQTVVATSSTEADYVAAASGYAQVLWMQNRLLDYGVFNSPMLHVLRVEMVINSTWMLSKNWLVEKQTTLGVNTPRSDEDRLKLMELMVFVLQNGVCDEFKLNAARLPKFLLSDAAGGFEQIIDFLSGSYIHHALTVNPHVYISCIKQFWNIVVVKRSGDVTRLQALVDKKRIVITEEVVREILQLNDAEGVICLPNDEIFASLARMGYEKPSTKLTFYKAFFSTQWKFFIHTILHSLSAKRTSWNEFSSAMASPLICLSTGQRFNFSKYIFESLVRNVDSSSKFYMYPRFIQLIIQSNIADLSKHTNRYISPVLTQKVFANMRRVGKGFLGVETPLFENMLVARAVDAEEEVQVPALDDVVQEHVTEEIADDSVLDTCSALVLRVEGLENANAAQHLEIVKLKSRVKKLERLNKVKSSKLRRLKKVGTSQRVKSSDDVENVFNQGRISVDMDQDEGFELVVDQEKDAEIEGRQADKQAEIYNIDLDHSSKVLSMQEDDTEVQEAIEVITTAKLITEVVTAAATQVVAASTPISVAKPKSLKIAAAPAVSTRKRKRVVIRDPEEELHIDTPAETPTVKDKGKGILIEDPKPMKKKDQVEMDAEYAKKLQEELDKEHEEAYKQIDWNAAFDNVQAKETQYIKRYHRFKKKPQSESEARKNMISYLKNTEGYKMEFFKGKTCDQILPIFQARFDANMKFLFKTREEIEKEDGEIIKSINETPAQKAAKRRKLGEEAQEADDLKKRLEIVQDEDDDVFVEAIPLAQKVPVVDYQKNDSEVQEVVEVVTTTKLITKVVTVAASQVSAASATILAASTTIPAASTTIPATKPIIPATAPTVVAAYTRRKGVIIRDLEEELSLKTPAETPKVKDKGKGILVETPKPMKKKDQIELDAEYAKKLHEEINKDYEEFIKDIDWDAAMDHVNKKSNNPQFDENMRFLFKLRKEMEEEDQEIIKSINETPTQKAAKRRKLSEEAQEAEDLRKRLEVVEDEDDDVLVEATPLASKNFDREDLENLWRIVKDKFSTSKRTNFSDEYILLTLKTMFEEPDGQDAIWRNQKIVHGLALVKKWKLLTSCGVHVITLST